jgi:hypothetical protein
MRDFDTAYIERLLSSFLAMVFLEQLFNVGDSQCLGEMEVRSTQQTLFFVVSDMIV